jgi:hypothetical protein
VIDSMACFDYKLAGTDKRMSSTGQRRRWKNKRELATIAKNRYNTGCTSHRRYVGSQMRFSLAVNERATNGVRARGVALTLIAQHVVKRGKTCRSCSLSELWFLTFIHALIARLQEPPIYPPNAEWRINTAP